MAKRLGAKKLILNLAIIILISFIYTQDLYLDKCLPSETDCSQSNSLLCCNHSNAICCSSGKHCCPNGYTCSEDGSFCSKKKDLFMSNLPDYTISIELKGVPSIQDITDCIFDIKPAASDLVKAIQLWSKLDKKSIEESKKYITQLVKDLKELDKDCFKLLEKILK